MITTTHHDPDPADHTERGSADSAILLSFGLVGRDDRIADLAQARHHCRTPVVHRPRAVRSDQRPARTAHHSPRKKA
ncbi:hypothetical protein ACFWJU_16335 [Streptomyces mutabilis]|uniref:hypothetical protein n=1 Tax=Streptomyces mutabilis TaxID=67332 RepID=UPI00364D207E